MDGKIMEKYEIWCKKAALDPDLKAELSAMKGDDAAIESAFYRSLEFGTAGLRGVIGAGTNRMNVYSVGQATKALADYIKNHFVEEKRTVAIGYDSRIKSELFAKTAAGVLAAAGIHVYIYSELLPVPCVSFAVRALHTAAGVMVTASHNPSKYNGYKVYDDAGCQIVTEAADEILADINATDYFTDVTFGDFDALLAEGKIEYTPEWVYRAYLDVVKRQSVLGNVAIDKDIAIVYTPLNGAGLKPVTEALKETGFTNITLVEEQKNPDGHFPTCPYPNPEIFEAMKLGMEYAEKTGAALLLATDPDSDRVGTAVRAKDGSYRLISGNEMGCLLLNYICELRTKNGTMPENPVAVKSIVSTDLVFGIAAHYGVEVKNVLTGFKFIGNEIAKLEEAGRPEAYIFGFEESYGYLPGGYVRDKDAVSASLLICEMFCYYQGQGVSLLEKLEELYETYGYYQNIGLAFSYEGIQGAARMKELMAAFRGGISAIGTSPVEKTEDYAAGLYGLPPADVLKFFLPEGTVIIRPSGTEPKVKVYFSVKGKTLEEAQATAEKLKALVTPMMA